MNPHDCLMMINNSMASSSSERGPAIHRLRPTNCSWYPHVLPVAETSQCLPSVVYPHLTNRLMERSILFRLHLPPHQQLLAASYVYLSVRRLPSNVMCTAIDHQRRRRVFCLFVAVDVAAAASFSYGLDGASSQLTRSRSVSYYPYVVMLQVQSSLTFSSLFPCNSGEILLYCLYTHVSTADAVTASSATTLINISLCFFFSPSALVSVNVKDDCAHMAAVYRFL